MNVYAVGWTALLPPIAVMHIIKKIVHF
ncbi:Protein of unknown function [Bacillus mycoides]|nr:Protein of unknown function [Bacillus mycoides]